MAVLCHFSVGGSPPYQLRADELRAIKAGLADRAKMKPYADAFFVSERRTAWCLQNGMGCEGTGFPMPAILIYSATPAASP